jgi:hypothetical protein
MAEQRYPIKNNNAGCLFPALSVPAVDSAEILFLFFRHPSNSAPIRHSGFNGRLEIRSSIQLSYGRGIYSIHYIIIKYK